MAVFSLRWRQYQNMAIMSHGGTFSAVCGCSVFGGNKTLADAVKPEYDGKPPPPARAVMSRRPEKIEERRFLDTPPEIAQDLVSVC